MSLRGTRERASEDRGSYVGLTSPDDALDVDETGAEARSENRNGLSPAATG